MGVIEEVFVAAEDGLAAVLPQGPTDGDSMVLDIMALLILGDLVLGTSNRDAGTFGDPVLDDGEEGPWIVRAPAGLAQALTALTDGEAVALARRWGVEWAEASETSAIPESWVKPMRRLRELAAAAESAGRGLFVWICL